MFNEGDRIGYTEPGKNTLPPTPGRVSKRRFLGYLGAAFGGLLVGEVIGEIIESEMVKKTGQATSIRQSLDIGESIRDFESQVGSYPLTFNQLNDYIPNIAELVRRESKSPKTIEELSKGIFIVRNPQADPAQLAQDLSSAMFGNEDPFANPTIQQFTKDYPDVKLQKEVARSYILGSILNAGWVDADNGNIYLSLNNINGVYRNTTSQDGLPPRLQYQGWGQIVTCSEPAPIVTVRSVLTHELIHRESRQEWQPLEEEVLSAYKDILKIPKEGVMLVLKRNFMLRFLTIGGGCTSPIPKGPYEYVQNHLNEFVTDYLASQIALKYELPFTLAYGYPIDLVNFRGVLSQGGISYAELYDLYRNAKIKEFLVKLADAAQGIDFESEGQKIKFALERFNLWSWTPNWSLKVAKFAPPIQPYFPGVDTELYVYTDPSQFDPQNWRDRKLGCSNPRR